MEKILQPAVLCGAVDAIPSKSHAHRLLIASALGDRPIKIKCKATSKDIEATAACLSGLGAQIERTDDGYLVTPIDRARAHDGEHLPCGESGSTLRFMLPVAAALGGKFVFELEGRLQNRPLSPLYEILEEDGISLSPKGSEPFEVSGKLKCREYSIAADVSSQFISGLLFACPLISDNCTIHLTTAPESTGYIDMTVAVLREFGVEVDIKEDGGLLSYSVCGSYKTLKDEISAEGDWSNAAFWLCAGAIGSAPVAVRGLDSHSLQPDRAIIDILERFGAEIEVSEGKYCVSPSSLTACEINVKNTPDLAPVLAVVAACAMGSTLICGAHRLKLKESDRIATVCEMIESLGGEAQAFDDSMKIHGTGLVGGEVSSHNDHRIAMAAAIAAAAACDDIKITGAEACDKSYPSFFEDYEKLKLSFQE